MKRSCPDYNTLCEVLSPLVTEAWKPQLNNLALFVYGLLMTGHVHLPKIALCLPIAGNTRNALQRLVQIPLESAHSFRLNVRGHSTPKRAVVPFGSVRSFHSKVRVHSTGMRAAIPLECAHVRPA